MLAVGRVAVGAAMTLFPGAAGRSWIGEPAAHGAVKVVIRAFGVRDLVLGLGTLRALDRGDDPAPWVRYSMVSDAVDATAGVLGYRHLPRFRRALLVLSAGGAAVTGAVAADHLD